jgi:ATP/maltotriose-dependent transcriptional regulator MalT
MYDSLGDRKGVGSALRSLGVLAQSEGRWAEARPMFEAAIGHFREIGHLLGVAWTLRNLGILAQVEGDYGRAATLFEESLPILREIGDAPGIARVLGSLGLLARLRGDRDGARTLLEESLSLVREAGDKRGMTMTLVALGSLARLRADWDTARQLLEESLDLAREDGDVGSVAHCLMEMGLVALQQGVRSRGVELISAAEAMHAVVQATLEPDQRDCVAHELARARRGLGEERYSNAQASGRRLSLDEAIAAACTAYEPAKRSWPGRLSEREVEVLRLVVRGQTNREIAAALVLSEYTVMRHLSNIFQKLGTSSRAAAASFAVREGIT